MNLLKYKTENVRDADEHVHDMLKNYNDLEYDLEELKCQYIATRYGKIWI